MPSLRGSTGTPKPLGRAEAAPPRVGDEAASVPRGEGCLYLFVAAPRASVRRRELCAILPEGPVEATARALS
jgi:hypothetical protein